VRLVARFASRWLQGSGGAGGGGGGGSEGATGEILIHGTCTPFVRLPGETGGVPEDPDPSVCADNGPYPPLLGSLELQPLLLPEVEAAAADETRLSSEGGPGGQHGTAEQLLVIASTAV